MSQRAHQGELSGTYWAPGQYLKFSEQRLWPALELLDRIPIAKPDVIYDLGCGSGQVTRFLARRWFSSEVYGLDNSPQMLAEAAREPSTVHWVCADIHTWVPRKSPDLIYSNAALHWVGGHSDLFQRLASYLNPGGCLAVQMPLSWNLPSHRRLMRDTLEGCGHDNKPLGDIALRTSLSTNWVENTDFYHDILAPLAQRLDIWETRYFHELEGEDAVFEWVKGSGLRPILNSLGDTERSRFLQAYRQRLRDAYPKRSGNRTVYLFPRLFIVALV